MNMSDYLILHLNTNKSKRRSCSKKGHGLNKHERIYNITRRHKLR